MFLRNFLDTVTTNSTQYTFFRSRYTIYILKIGSIKWNQIRRTPFIISSTNAVNTNTHQPDLITPTPDALASTSASIQESIETEADMKNPHKKERVQPTPRVSLVANSLR